MYITKGADRYQWDVIYKYDIKWRMKKAKDNSLSWGVKDQDLWSDEVQRRGSMTPPVNVSYPSPPVHLNRNMEKQGGPGYDPPPCWNWNKAYCNRPNFKYHHKCRRYF